MSRPASKPPTPAEIYAASLERFSLGHPLWSPAPLSPTPPRISTEPQAFTTPHAPTEQSQVPADALQISSSQRASAEPQVADVGFLFDGGFIRLFHLYASEPTRKVTHFHPPFNDIAQLEENTFHPLPKPDPPQAGHYCSRGVTRREVHGSVNVAVGPNASAGLQAEYFCREARGAALTLQSDTEAVVSLPSKLLSKYIKRHLSTWHRYATRKLGLELKQEDIAVVIGWTKTAPDWAATVFGVDDATSAAVSLTANVASSATIDVGGSFSASHVTSPVQKYGPNYFQPRAKFEDHVDRKDQSVFLKLARAKTRPLLPPRMIAGAGDNDLPPWRQRAQEALYVAENYVTEEHNYAKQCWQENMGNRRAPDRLDMLQDYIFEITPATVAIASDDQIDSLLCGQHIIDFASWLRKVQPQVEVDNDGAGSLCMNELIRHKQERKFAHPPITASDRADWPQITRKGAGTLTDSQIRLGPTEAKAPPVNYKAVVFGDSKTMKINDKYCVSLSTDGKLLAAAMDNTVVVWRLQDGLTVQRFERDGHTEELNQIAFSPDGHHIVSGADDKLALVWNVKTGDVVHRLEGHKGAVWRVAFSPDGTQIATRSLNSLRLWAASSGDLLHAITDLESNDSIEILFSPDGSCIAARADASDMAVAVFDCRTGERIATLRKKDIQCMAFAPEGDRIATGSRDGTTCVWDAASGETLLELKEHTDWVREVAFSPDGGEVATASYDGTVVTCDSRTGERRFTFRVESVRGKDKEGVNTVAYSYRHTFIACGAEDGCVRVWDHRSGAFVAAFQGHTDRVRRVMFTPDDWDILSYGNDQVVRLWSVRDALRLS